MHARNRSLRLYTWGLARVVVRIPNASSKVVTQVWTCTVRGALATIPCRVTRVGIEGEKRRVRNRLQECLCKQLRDANVGTRMACANTACNVLRRQVNGNNTYYATRILAMWCGMYYIGIPSCPNHKDGRSFFCRDMDNLRDQSACEWLQAMRQRKRQITGDPCEFNRKASKYING